jgi:chemotaxis protein CheC
MALALPIPAAIDHAGPGEMVVTTVVTPVTGDLHALVILVMQPRTVDVACRLLGVEAHSEVGRSALAELGNILSASYLGGLSTLTGLALDSSPPEVVSDMLAAVLTSALLMDFDDEQVILLESTLSVADDECSPTFLFVPTRGGVGEILGRLGVAA